MSITLFIHTKVKVKRSTSTFVLYCFSLSVMSTIHIQSLGKMLALRPWLVNYERIE